MNNAELTLYLLDLEYEAENIYYESEFIVDNKHADRMKAMAAHIRDKARHMNEQLYRDTVETEMAKEL